MDGAGNNFKKVLRSRNGVKITLDDTDGQEKLILETPGGQKVTLKDGPGAVEIVDSNGNSVKLETSGITITASAKVTVNASTGRSLGRHGDGQRRHVEVQRRRAGRHGHQQQRHQRLLHAGRGQHLVTV